MSAKMNTAKSINILTLGRILLILMLPLHLATAQNGGVSSIFTDAGVGARALSLGSAFVAQADNPTAVYWNAAGLDFIGKRSASFFYSSLGYGTTYNFIGLAYPTLAIGTFGVGWARIGTDDIKETEPDASLSSVGDYSINQFFVSYAKRIRKSVSIGGSVKLERPDFALGNNISDSGIGLDLGVIYRPEFDNVLMRDISLGVNLQNIIKPKVRLVDQSESSPTNFKIGLAKPFRFGEERNLFRLLFDLNKSEDGDGTFHIGSEYVFRDQANLRVGFNDGQVAFGAGATYNNFHFDYNFGKYFDGVDFSSRHRFSVTIEFGKSRQELIRIAQERREQELNIRLQSELWFNAETEFNSSMEDGRLQYYDKDYLAAYVEFSSAFDAASSLQEIAMRLRGEVTDDPEANMRVETANSSLREAQQMLEVANARSDSVRREEQKAIILEARKSAIEQELQDFILEHREKGIAFFKGGFFTRAISEWRLAVDRISRMDPETVPAWVAEVKLQLENDIKTAEKQLQGNIQETLRRADALARRGQYVQALDELNKVRGTGISEVERKEIERRIRRMQGQLSFRQNYDDGVRFYAGKQWKKAAAAFERALKSKPNDAKAQTYFEEAQARAIATVQQMPPNLRAKYVRGHALYRKGNYQEARNIWEQILKEQPYNKTVLDAIDSARERLNKQQRH